MGRPKKRRLEELECHTPEQNLNNNVGENNSVATLKIDKAYPDKSKSNAFSSSSQGGFHSDLQLKDDGARDIHAPISNFHKHETVTPPLSLNEISVKFDDNSLELPETPLNRQSCACLSTIYLELSDLNSLKSFAFPVALLPLQKAMNTAKSAIECSACPKSAISVVQNLHLVVTLLSSIAERFQKVSHAIDSKAAILRETGNAHEFQFFDKSMAPPVHAMDASRPTTFSFKMHVEEWQQMANNVIRSNVKHLPSQNSNTTLEGLLLQLEARQARWHTDEEMIQRMSETQRDCSTNLPMKANLCMRMLDSVRKMICRI